MIAAVLLVYGLVGFFTARHLVRQKYWRDLAVFGVLLVLGLGMTVLFMKDVELPNPFNAYNDLLEGLGLHY